jgi:hypothetical protein
MLGTLGTMLVNIALGKRSDGTTEAALVGWPEHLATDCIHETTGSIP